MRQFFATIIAIVFLMGAVPASAHDEPRRGMSPEEAYVFGQIIGAIGNIASGAIERHQYRHHYHQYRPRYQPHYGGYYEPPRHPHYGGYYQPRPRNYGAYNQPRPRYYDPEGDWIHRGGGWRVGPGQHCSGRLQYDLQDGGYYCR